MSSVQRGNGSIAILGADGQLGEGFVRALGPACRPFTRADVDLTDIDAIGRWTRSVTSELVINCAAYTQVDKAEDDVETAHRVNALAVGALAGAMAGHQVRFVTFSTDYVFDGAKEDGYIESDTPHPLNVYGQTKLEGERRALAANPDALVIRTSWLLSSTHRNFLTAVLEQLTRSGEASVVDDQRGRPTFVDDLVVATLDAINRKAAGLLHLTNQGETTWFGLARQIAVAAGFEPDRVRPQSSGDLDRPALRPRNSLLSSERLRALGMSRLADYAVRVPETVEEVMNKSR
jgi:dTDP-4-dehydrorhamnose reductase